ncbi:diacylglycerol kinase [Streptomyces sp. SID5468]|nr:hypothetical protein [Streptomyces sp. SID5468]MYS60241.1 diacylglycerol kinase [Streptomyces sp. SID5468]
MLVVIDPAARTTDGESVRIAQDVLRAGAPSLKICLPESGEELRRVLAHRGRRHPVVVGDDRALLHTVRILHRQRALGEAPLSLVPVGQRPRLAVARALGVPQSAVAAARAVLDGAERPVDLLVDDSGGIVLSGLRIPGPQPDRPAGPGRWPGRGARTLLRALTGPLPARPAPDGVHRLRVEADGVVLTDLDRPLHEVSVRVPADGLAEVLVHRPHDERPVRVRARAVTVSGRDFRYRADDSPAGPVRRRTWTVEPAAWRLTVPHPAG